MIQSKSLICSNRHCFDLAKQGYVNLLPRVNKTKYDKPLFEYRRLICNNGFFDPLTTRISEIIRGHLHDDGPTRLLDAGCGEGSHLTKIQQNLSPCATGSLLAVGIDIAKEGIIAAATEYSNAIWCVADLAKCPFADQQFHFILNILSPANYSEFRRLMLDEGMVIKVVPERDHLIEIRDRVYEGFAKEAYSNANIRNQFKEHFTIMNVDHVRYQVNVNERLIGPLLGMTPLTWRLTAEGLLSMHSRDLRKVTMDFMILVGMK
nr:methyltransferase domain-containing protein [Paenibacillus sp. HB172176]